MRPPSPSVSSLPQCAISGSDDRATRDRDGRAIPRPRVAHGTQPPMVAWQDLAAVPRERRAPKCPSSPPRDEQASRRSRPSLPHLARIAIAVTSVYVRASTVPVLVDRLASVLSASASGPAASWSSCSPDSESRQTSTFFRLRSNPACNIEDGPPLSSLLGDSRSVSPEEALLHGSPLRESPRDAPALFAGVLPSPVASRRCLRRPAWTSMTPSCALTTSTFAPPTGSAPVTR